MYDYVQLSIMLHIIIENHNFFCVSWLTYLRKIGTLKRKMGAFKRKKFVENKRIKEKKNRRKFKHNLPRPIYTPVTLCVGLLCTWCTLCTAEAYMALFRATRG